ncbi:MAG TPA: hypothetical protein VF756_19860 [Thermoanaerobaculia bacterium]
MAEEWPDKLAVNAWTGEEEPAADVSDQAKAWAVRRQIDKVPRLLAAPEPVDLRDWRKPEVGWGLVLPENEQISVADRAAGADAPEPIRKLLADRAGAPVFRYRPDLQNRFLRRYYTDRAAQDVAISGSPRGTAPGKLPWYLLLCGSPEALPWDLQYVLNTAAFVGRLDLDDEGLARYVDALIGDWAGSACRPEQPVVWAVDHGPSDITFLMRQSIAEPVAKLLHDDTQIQDGLRRLAGADATAGALIDTLAARQPALVVTTSHGMTGPLNDLDLMAAQLGFLVDDRHAALGPDDLLAKWQPDGAIWYAHACCSAGSDARTRYKGLVSEGSSVEKILTAVAGLGARVAPLPRKLLGAEKPLRAFVGHVEPTFDWTLRAETGQVLTSTIQKALYERMYRARPEPVGMSFEGVYRHVGELLAQWQQAFDGINQGAPGARAAALRSQLTALDRQSMVILGDPTAAIPPLA